MMNPGEMIMGKQGNGQRIKFGVENVQDIDRKIQSKMYQ